MKQSIFYHVAALITAAVAVAGCDIDQIRPPQRMTIVIPKGFNGVISMVEDRSRGLDLPNARTFTLHVPKSGIIKIKDAKRLLDWSVKPPVAYRRMKFTWTNGSEIPSYYTGLDRAVSVHEFGQSKTYYQVYIGTTKASEKAEWESLGRSMRGEDAGNRR